MSIATAVILNVAAVVGLLALLAATMRLPYHMPTTPRAGPARRRKTASGERPRRPLPARAARVECRSPVTPDRCICDQAAARSGDHGRVDRHRGEKKRQVEQREVEQPPGVGGIGLVSKAEREPDEDRVQSQRRAQIHVADRVP